MINGRVIPHRTRVFVPGRGFGIVVAVANGQRRLIGAKIINGEGRLEVLLDAGGNRVSVSAREATLA